MRNRKAMEPITHDVWGEMQYLRHSQEDKHMKHLLQEALNDPKVRKKTAHAIDKLSMPRPSGITCPECMQDMFELMNYAPELANDNKVRLACTCGMTLLKDGWR
jgi:hypothetical protein